MTEKRPVEEERAPATIPTQDRVEFEHNFIRTAVCELRFPTLVEFQEGELVDFQRRLRKEFPIVDAGLNLGPSHEGLTPVKLMRSKGGDAVERLQNARMTLLRRADRGDALTTEDEARYAYATARLERLVPRVTAADLERLADMADEIADLGEELDGIRAELDEEAASASGRRKR